MMQEQFYVIGGSVPAIGVSRAAILAHAHRAGPALDQRRASVDLQCATTIAAGESSQRTIDATAKGDDLEQLTHFSRTQKLLCL